MYHGISNDTDERRRSYFRTVTRPETFESHIQFLVKAGYIVPTLSNAMKMLADNDWCDTDKLAVITFDDGLQDFYTSAYPTLSRYGYLATVFLSTAYIDRDFITGAPCLTASQIHELSSCGIEFGSHTVTHPQLLELDEKDIVNELAESRQTIENITGQEATSFSYPFRFPEEDNTFVRFLAGALRESGYRRGVTTTIGRWQPESQGMFLPRLPINDLDDPSLFSAKLCGNYDWMHQAQLAAKRLRAISTLSKSARA